MKSIYISIISIIIAISLCGMVSAATIDGVYTYYQFTVAGSDYMNFSVVPYPSSNANNKKVGLYSELITSSGSIYSHTNASVYGSSRPKNLWKTIGDPLYSNVVAISAWGPGHSGSISSVSVLFITDDIKVQDDYIAADFKVGTILPKDYEIDPDVFTLTVFDDTGYFVEISPDVIDVTIKSYTVNNTIYYYYQFNLRYYFTVYSSSNPDIHSARITFPCKYSTTMTDSAYDMTLCSFDDLIISKISVSDYEEIQKGQASFEPIINIYTQQTPEDLEHIEQGKQQGDKLSGEIDKLDEANKKLEEALGDNYVEDPTELVQKPDIFDNENFNDNIASLTNSIWDDAIITPMFGIVSGLSILSYVLFGKKDK